MLRACHTVLKPGGRIAYFNIFISHDVPEEERRRLRDAGHGERYTRAEQQALLRSAGFARIRETDVTDGYLRVQRALYEANVRHARGAQRVQGRQQFADRQETRRRTIREIEAGVLKRSLFVAERP